MIEEYKVGVVGIKFIKFVLFEGEMSVSGLVYFILM